MMMVSVALPCASADSVFPAQPVLDDYLQWAVDHHPALEAGRAQ